LPHAGKDPHVHAPLAHESLLVESQGRHEPPPEPHVAVDGVLHVLPEQHPETHVCVHPVQAPSRQVPPPVHAAHADPAMPHAVAEGAVHALPLQHPEGHDAAVQTHWPPTHA
jgi:hypothetical protein